MIIRDYWTETQKRCMKDLNTLQLRELEHIESLQRFQAGVVSLRMELLRIRVPTDWPVRVYSFEHQLLKAEHTISRSLLNTCPIELPQRQKQPTLSSTKMSTLR